MRAALMLPAFLLLTACFGAAPPEPEEPTIQTAIADAIISENGETGAEPEKPKLFAFLRAKPAPEPETTADIKIATAQVPGANQDGNAIAGVDGVKSLQAARSGGPGKTLPFGTVGMACGLSRHDLGKKVDAFPRSGRAKWKLYDTDTGSTARRTQFITGFSDGCARQFTAALALFGSPRLHEIHRYGAAQKRVPYSKADKAYENIKSAVCGVGRGKPCPKSHAGTLQRGTSFVSVYRQFGGSAPWLEILLHDGKLIASETRSR